MTKDRKKYYSEVKNRYGYTSFIKDHEEMAKDYEKVLETDDNFFIDNLDHFFIATVNELGIRKEMEIKALKKENKKLKKLLKKQDILLEFQEDNI